MCNHYRTHPEMLRSWAEYIGADIKPGASALPEDIWPRRQAPVALGGQGQMRLGPMVWGVPMTMAGKRPGSSITKFVTNVRNLESPFWRTMLDRPAQRCLVPFSSFAEPVLGAGRAEHWFGLSDGQAGAFAGIWRMVEGRAHFAFLTCEPNALVAPLHPKAMPVILAGEDYAGWLTGSGDAARRLATPYPSQLMLVDSPRAAAD